MTDDIMVNEHFAPPQLPLNDKQPLTGFEKTIQIGQAIELLRNAGYIVREPGICSECGMRIADGIDYCSGKPRSAGDCDYLKYQAKTIS